MEAYQKLEEEFGRWAQVQNVVGCSSGTAALHLALEALSPSKAVDPEAEILLPDYTMVACARAVTMAGYRPIFVDCRRRDLLIDPNKLASTVSERWRRGSRITGIMVVHVYGRPVEMGPVIDLATEYDLKVVEDLAEGHGISPHPKSDAACWSFYRNKIIFGEEGGVVAFKDPEMAKRAKCLRTLGFTADHDYTHVPRGHNYRLSNLHADAILHSLSQASSWQELRRLQVRDLDRACPKHWQMPQRVANWIYDFRVTGMTKEWQRASVLAIQKLGVGARYGFKPMTSQEEYNPISGVAFEYTPEAYSAAREVIYLPLGQSAPEEGYEDGLAAKIFEAVLSARDMESMSISPPV